MACVVLAVRPEPTTTGKQTAIEKSYEVLDNPRWYENDPFLVQEPIDGKLPAGPLRFTTTAIEGREWSCMRAVLDEYARNPAIADRLTKYAEHHNRKVAIEAVAALVRGRDWTLERATQFAAQHSWKPEETDKLVRSARTPLEAACEVLDNPRWYENDPMFSSPEPTDDSRREAYQTWKVKAIRQREFDSIMVILNEYGRDASLGERVRMYAEHGNRAVALKAAIGLVRSGEWTSTAAVAFGEQHGWKPEEIREIQRVPEAIPNP